MEVVVDLARMCERVVFRREVVQEHLPVERAGGHDRGLLRVAGDAHEARRVLEADFRRLLGVEISAEHRPDSERPGEHAPTVQVELAKRGNEDLWERDWNQRAGY